MLVEKVFLVFASFMVLANCVQQMGLVPGFGSQSEEVVDEGNGNVSFRNSAHSDTGSWSYKFRMIECSSGHSVSAFDYAEIEGPEHPEHVWLGTYVNSLDAQSGLKDVDAVFRDLKQSDYGAQLARVYTDDKVAARGCSRFYPLVRRDWRVKTAKQIADERAYIERVRASIGEIVYGIDEDPKRLRKTH
jgi:hypothetical protein